MLVTFMVMDQEEITHQQSLVTDSFSTIERLENEMAAITREFENLDKTAEPLEESQLANSPAADTRDVDSQANEDQPENSESATNSQGE